MDLTKPIDITAVIGAVKEHRDLLVTLDSEAAADMLQHFTAIPGVKDSLVLGRTTLGQVSRKYTGHFVGTKEAGKIVPRTLVVNPCVMEMDDEPERYRRSYITEVKGGLDPMGHPFEIWLINYGLKAASQELHDAMMVAKLNDDGNDLTDSFNGLGSIIEDERTAGNFSVANGNVFETGELTRANIGFKLLAMYRHMPNTFRKKAEQKLYLSADLGDMYDDWLNDQGVLVLSQMTETTDQKYLRGTNNKLEIVRLTNLPEGSQFCMMTTKLNVVYGYDTDADFQSIMPFCSGNPYHFTAAGKYVIGFQLVTLDKSEVCINDRHIDPADDPEPTQPLYIEKVIGVDGEDWEEGMEVDSILDVIADTEGEETTVVMSAPVDGNVVTVKVGYVESYFESFTEVLSVAGKEIKFRTQDEYEEPYLKLSYITVTIAGTDYTIHYNVD